MSSSHNDSTESIKMVTEREAWVGTDEDCETGFLVDAPEGITADDAVAMFVRLFEDEFGPVRSVDSDPLGADLRPYREAREGEPYYEEAALVPCKPGEEPGEMVWVIEGIEW